MPMLARESIGRAFMTTVRDSLEQTISAAIARVTGESDCRANVIPASRPEFGDYQANGVMAIAKRLRTNPRDLAQQVLDNLEANAMVAAFAIAGPGFINIILSDEWLAAQCSELVEDDTRLIPPVNSPETIVVDYSSPNLAKEMHVGHLRGTIIGDSLARILNRLGHNVIRQNHVGDWGTQFGMLIAYMQNLASEESRLATELADLEVFYRAAKARFDNDPAFAETARSSVVTLQSGDPASLAIWQQFINESLSHCEALYQRLNILLQRTDLRPESFYNPQLAGIVRNLDESGLLRVSEGAKCVFLPEFTGKDGAPLPVIVQKSDGGYLYSTTDLAAIKFRAGELAADRILYVVDARQSLHFQQIFAVARKAGYCPANCQLQHVAYGTMMGKDGRPFKTRSGDTIKLADLLDEARERAFQLVTEKNPDLDEKLRRQIAETVGIGAVKYADLSKNRTSDYVFDWDSMLSFDGNTAPYLLYAYTRIKSILRKQVPEETISSEILIAHPAERLLLLKVLQLPEVVQSVADDLFPNHLCNHLYELAAQFMRFYEECPILKADAPTRASRLAMAALTARALHSGLNLLGLETLEQM